MKNNRRKENNRKGGEKRRIRGKREQENRRGGEERELRIEDVRGVFICLNFEFFFLVSSYIHTYVLRITCPLATCHLPWVSSWLVWLGNSEFNPTT